MDDSIEKPVSKTCVLRCVGVVKTGGLVYNRKTEKQRLRIL